jgi:hypothetical protein
LTDTLSQALMANRLVTALFLAATLGCGEPPSDDLPAQATLLSSNNATDTLEIHLTRHLQRLIAAFAADDSAAIVDLITVDFTAVDTRIVSLPTSRGSAPGEQLNYWQVTAGGLSGRLDPDYSSFAADADDTTARVYAIGTSHDLWTTWLYRDDHWKAETLIFIRRASSQSSGVGPRPGPRSR